MGSSVTPPLPPGFTLDAQPSGESLPPLPPGFTLDRPEQPQKVNPIDYEDAMFPGPGAGGGPKLAGATLAGAAVMGGVGAAPGATMGLLKSLGNPYVAGGLTAALKLYKSHDPIDAVESGIKIGVQTALGGAAAGLLSKLRGLSAVASVAPAIAEATAGLESAAAPVAEATAARAYQGIPSMMQVGAPAGVDAAAAANAAQASLGARGATSIADMVQPAGQAVQAATDLSGTGGGASGYVADLVNAKAAAPAAESGAKGLMSFAKQIADRNPKIGEKIWMLLDDAGKPLKMLTPDEAGAAARKGLPTTWVKNLWER